MGLIFNSVVSSGWITEGSKFYTLMNTPFWQHLIIGGFAFGVVFMATDPVTASQTNKGKWIYGFLIGFLSIINSCIQSCLSRRCNVGNFINERICTYN